MNEQTKIELLKIALELTKLALEKGTDTNAIKVFKECFEMVSYKYDGIDKS